MKVLIVGCGYLGSRTAALWQAEGQEIFVTTRSRAKADQWRAQGFRPVVADVTDAETLRQLPEVDVCLYAVGYDRTAGPSKQEVYVHGLAQVLAKLGERCQRLIYISSSSVYGQESGEVVDCHSPCHPVSDSGQICLTAETMLRQYLTANHKAFPQGGQIVRLSGIYGPQRLLTRIDQLRNGYPLGGLGEAWLNLIHVDDAAQAIVQIAAAPESKWGGRPDCWLLSDECPVRRDEFYTFLAELVGAPPPTFDVEQPKRNGQVGSGKRCSSVHVCEEFGLTLRFGNYRIGLPDAVARTPLS